MEKREHYTAYGANKAEKISRKIQYSPRFSPVNNSKSQLATECLKRFIKPNRQHQNTGH